MKYASAGVALGALCLALPAQADPLPRPLPAAGSVIARKSGEEVRFVDVSNWRYVDLQQDLLTGDVLRTNATGQLAVLFSDRTQVRLGRNTSLLVKQMGGSGDTGLELQSGTIWARAERGGQGVVIDTPAAAAAIRGTDWTMTVGADGKTSLIVLEGLVELSNAYGSVQVAQGEGAVAAIGKAPSKIIIVKPKDREQMLFNLSLRSAFQWMPATPLIVPQMRSERSRIEMEEASTRSAADWLSLSEIYLALDGKQKAKAALDEARLRGLRGAQVARADLLEALIAGSENRYKDAATLFEKARPGLDAKRRAIAAYGGYFARSLADPNHVEEPPTVANSSYAVMAKAWSAGFRKDIPAALATIKEGERAARNDPTLPGARALVGLLLADEEEIVSGFEQALAIDPEDPTGLEARANYKLHILNDRQGALDDLNRALKTAPGSSAIWDAIGFVQSDLDANREAEAAYKKAIELDPLDPVSHANLASLYLIEMRMAEAKREIDEALEIDPSFDIALVARGRYYLQSGEMDKAVEDLLAGSTANPGYSQAQLLLAAAYYEKGDRVPAAQALDNAERLDPNDPVIPVVRTAIAIDEYDSDAAIRYAQEIMRRTRAQGGDFAPLGANQEAGSTLNDAFRLQGLDAWGQYYGDAVFDAFTGSSYVDQAVRGSVNPFVNTYSYDNTSIVNSSNEASFSAFFQGLLLEPHMLASRERTANLAQMPFFEAVLGGGVTVDSENTGWNAEAEIRALTLSPYPISFYGNLQWSEPKDSLDVGSGLTLEREIDIIGGNGYFSQSPTPDDRIVAYLNYASSDELQNIAGLPPLFARSDGFDVSQLTTGLGWSHTFGYRNVANAALFYTDQKTTSRNDATYVDILVTPLGDVSVPRRTILVDDRSQKSYMATLSHTYGDGDLTWRYGVEGGLVKAPSETTVYDYFPYFPGVPATSISAPASETSTLVRAYIDALYEITPDLKAEGALFGRYVNGDSENIARLEPRLGLAWAPADGHWLRAAFLRQGDDFETATLSPIGIVGLQTNQTDVASTGYMDTFALRWDAEWSDRVFTAIDYQHQELKDLSVTLPLSNSALIVADGRIDRVAMTANIALGHGFGLSATAAYTDSENRDPTAGPVGGPIPFIPDKTGQVALTWVNTANIKATLAANYVGERVVPGVGLPVDNYWTLDAALIWEPFDKHVEVELAAFNLLDEDFNLAPGIPGWGPTFKGTVKVRF
ncbi:FecR domain-containing protein [Pararhizobium sp. LjRoot238]|uniref:FecR domain-containing protein n=1 Tax=Pararhizobium sp. LjRoot238 TaxID=3342293 RepID=UPI003ED11D80